MSMRCLRIPVLGMILGAAVLLFGAPQARAVGENPTIDGDLTDLIAAVTANSGSANGGFAFTDPSGDVFTQACSFVNGYDITNAYAYFRLKDGSGAYTPNNVQLYLGWKVTGVIGDVDGDGTADIFNPPGNSCAISDGDGGSGCASGIGAGESYSILIDLNCDNITDLRLGVSNNTVAALTAGGDVLKAVSGAFCRNGNSLEMRLDNYQNLIKDPTLVPSNLGADLCRARIRMFANAADDLLGEDSTPSADLDIPPSIKITKLPATQDACPGTNVSWTLQVCNNGICPFSSVDVIDTLDTGLTYVSDDKGSTQGANAHIRHWSLGALDVGACTSISLTASVDAPCVAPQLKNNVTAQGTHDRGACGESELALSHADALVNCSQPDVNISKSVSPGSILPGGQTTVTLTVSNPAGGSALDPVTVCDKLDAGVTFDAAQVIGGTCQATLSSNTLNGDGTRTICFSAFSLNAGQSCTITYTVACASSGVHPDTATVTAYCKGSETNPIIKRAFSSFTCQGGGSCPRTVGYWAAQCAQKLNGSTKFTRDQVTKIAQCVDGSVQIFQFSDPFNEFCAIISPEKPMDCRKQALRQFAGLLANSCVGSLGFKASNGDSVFLNLDDPNPCTSTFPDAKTLGDLIKAIDQALVDLKNANADAQDSRYCAIVECADGINNGRGIPLAPGCGEGVSAPSRTVSGELGLDSRSGGVQTSTIQLYQPVPNPFSNTTTIGYAVGGSAPQRVQIGIYNVAGRLIRELVNESRAPGQYMTEWRGLDQGDSQVAHGVYFIRAYVGGVRVDTASRVLYLR